MLSLIKLKDVLLYVMLLMIPYMVQGGDFNNFNGNTKRSFHHHIEQNLDHHFDQNKKKQLFQLKNLNGMWFVRFESIGGVDGGVGKSVLIEALVQFGSRGKGKMKYLEGAIYEGSPGEILSPSVENIDNVTLILKITDPILGLGRLIIKDPASPKQVYNVILRRNLENDEIIEISGIGSPHSFIESIVFLRQNI